MFVITQWNFGVKTIIKKIRLDIKKYMRFTMYNKILNLARTHKKIANKIIEISSLKRDDSIIDVGGGSGLLVNHLSKKFSEITVLEPSKSMTNNIADSNITIINSTIQEWNSKKKYDGVICFDSLHHFANGYQNGYEQVMFGIYKMIDHAKKEVIIIEPRTSTLQGGWIRFEENALAGIGSFFLNRKDFEEILRGYNYTIENFKHFYVVTVRK